MYTPRKINYISRIVQCDDDKYRFDIMYFEQLCVTDNKQYATADECIDAMCNYLKKLSAHSLHEPFEVVLY